MNLTKILSFGLLGHTSQDYINAGSAATTITQRELKDAGDKLQDIRTELNRLAAKIPKDANNITLRNIASSLERTEKHATQIKVHLEELKKHLQHLEHHIDQHKNNHQ